MRKIINFVLLMALVGSTVYVVYTHQEEVRGLVNIVGRKIAPCASPVTYSIGSIDTRFGISKKTLVTELKDAEAIWERASGTDLFGYEESGGDVTVSLVYDERQAATDKLKAAGIQMDKSKAGYDVLKARYDALSAKVRSEQSEYERLAALYEDDLAAYNREVERWNRQGGAPEAAYVELQAQKAALEREFVAVKSFERALNANIDILNALATTLNQLIVQLNLNVEQYNRTGATLGEFEEGLYRRSGGVQSIEIYEYSDRVHLVRVLAHEMGHALGLDHVGEPEAIMYKLNQGDTLTATAADVAELDRVCRSGGR